jgi:hypothetical protein
MAATPPPERAVDELLRELADEAGTLVREEIALARKELESQVRELGVGAGLLGAAGLLGLLSAGTGTAALVLLLARRPRPWFAAATVSGAYAGAGAMLAREGRRRITAVGVPVPEQTAETLKEGLPWPTRQTGSAPT